jgi:hypothetical protein
MESEATDMSKFTGTKFISVYKRVMYRTPVYTTSYQPPRLIAVDETGRSSNVLPSGVMELIQQTAYNYLLSTSGPVNLADLNHAINAQLIHVYGRTWSSAIFNTAIRAALKREQNFRNLQKQEAYRRGEPVSARPVAIRTFY